MNAQPTKPAWHSLSITLLTLAAALLTAPAASCADTIYVAMNWDSWSGVHVGSPNVSSVRRYTPDGVGSLFAYGPGIDILGGINCDSTGNVYVTDPGNGRITMIPADGSQGTWGWTFSDPTLCNPSGCACDSAGNLYVANYGNNTIAKLTPDGVGSVFADTGLDQPQGLAIDGAGNLYVVNNGNNTIERFTPDGVGSVFADTGLDQPRGLATDGAGNLYVANYGNNTIAKLTPDGVASLFANTGSGSPIGLAFGSGDILYAANIDHSRGTTREDWSGWIERYTPDGVGSVFADTGTDMPLYIAVQVPEPSTWALLGFGITALLALRHPNKGQL